MAVCLIVAYGATDPKGFEGYAPGVLPLLQKRGAQVPAADFEAEALEGQAHGVNVVLKFDSEQAARSFYNDPAYAPPRQVRLNSAQSGAVVMAREFKPPAA